jgi:prolyl-tRNA synthetase
VLGDGPRGLEPLPSPASVRGLAADVLAQPRRPVASPGVLLWSKSLLQTRRDDPADAEVPGHRLLVRAGYVRRVSPGMFTLLPLGLKVVQRISDVVREEMAAIGGQEVLFPALLPREPYEATGRWTEYGDTLFRLQDRRGADLLLGPTHEELFTLLVKGECSSWRDLPLTLFQIQTKYRDEARPRGGLLRGREFVMKDSYSFDLADEGLVASYDAHRGAYQRVFDRLGVDYRIVSAMSGAMGGSRSEEFLAPTEVGEDTFVSCAACGYAANVEAATAAVPDTGDAEHPRLEVLDTPDTPTIETLVALLGVPASATLKNLVVVVTQPDGERSLLAVAVPGDREVDLERLAGVVAPATVAAATAEDLAGEPRLVKGYVGPQDMAGTVLEWWADPRVAKGTAWVTGANAAGHHARNVVCGRDFEVQRYVDVAEVLDGDPCPTCGEPLSLDRAVEVGHIFQLGRKYADAFALDVLGADGKPARVTMGSYGIGVTRLVAVIAEQHHDDLGLDWPAAVAPALVHVVVAGKADHLAAAVALAAELEAAGLPTLVDDRPGASAGVKFTDAELLGLPVILTVGRGLANGTVELRDRRSSDRTEVPLADAVEAVRALVSSGR